MRNFQAKRIIFEIVTVLFWMVAIAGAIQNSILWLNDSYAIMIMLLVPSLMFVAYWILRIFKVWIHELLLLTFVGYTNMSTIGVLVIVFIIDFSYGTAYGGPYSFMWSFWVDYLGLIIAFPAIIISILFSVLVWMIYRKEKQVEEKLITQNQ